MLILLDPKLEKETAKAAISAALRSSLQVHPVFGTRRPGVRIPSPRPCFQRLAICRSARGTGVGHPIHASLSLVKSTE
jgi:hypothetical protein